MSSVQHGRAVCFNMLDATLKNSDVSYTNQNQESIFPFYIHWKMDVNQMDWSVCKLVFFAANGNKKLLLLSTCNKASMKTGWNSERQSSSFPIQKKQISFLFVFLFFFLPHSLLCHQDYEKYNNCEDQRKKC